VIAAGDLLLEPARKEVRERALDPMNKTPILEASLGNDAGMIGAAALARTELARSGGAELAREGG
jgi:glucokinase